MEGWDRSKRYEDGAAPAPSSHIAHLSLREASLTLVAHSSARRVNLGLATSFPSRAEKNVFAYSCRIWNSCASCEANTSRKTSRLGRQRGRFDRTPRHLLPHWYVPDTFATLLPPLRGTVGEPQFLRAGCTYRLPCWTPFIAQERWNEAEWVELSRTAALNPMWSLT